MEENNRTWWEAAKRSGAELDLEYFGVSPQGIYTYEGWESERFPRQIGNTHSGATLELEEHSSQEQFILVGLCLAVSQSQKALKPNMAEYTPTLNTKDKRLE